MVRREIAPTSQALQVAFSRLFREPMLSESTSFGSRWGIYEMGSRDHVHAKPGPGEAGRLRRSLPERLDLRLPLRRGLRELAPGDLVAGRRHRPRARALRADRGHAGAARDAPADGERAGRSYADQGARTARLYGPELRPAHADLGDPGSPRLWRYPGRVLPAGKIRGRGKQTPNSSENSRSQASCLQPHLAASSNLQRLLHRPGLVAGLLVLQGGHGVGDDPAAGLEVSRSFHEERGAQGYAGVEAAVHAVVAGGAGVGAAAGRF